MPSYWKPSKIFCIFMNRWKDSLRKRRGTGMGKWIFDMSIKNFDIKIYRIIKDDDKIANHHFIKTIFKVEIVMNYSITYLID